jgi:hypothetical protein
VQRSSPSIAALATALAKAQIELTNPEKSLTGTIEPQGGEGGARQFRYAPLSSGLEIVRKTLGQHEIATVQTTAIDQAVGIVNLTTVLAHSSGEWIASDWPVCPIAETATPHRMGAALTYARRYALFALVGIAGEDDLDAPDLLSPAIPESRADSPSVNKKDRLNGGQRQSVQGAQGNRRTNTGSSRSTLEPDASAALRDQLTSELSAISSSEEAADWAHRVLGAKNSLIAAEAHQPPPSQGVVHVLMGQPHFGNHDSDGAAQDRANTMTAGGIKSDDPVEFARCFLRLANLPNFALDRLSRYEATLWRQAGRILFALDALDRRKPQERGRRFRSSVRNLTTRCRRRERAYFVNIPVWNGDRTANRPSRSRPVIKPRAVAHWVRAETLDVRPSAYLHCRYSWRGS